MRLVPPSRALPGVRRFIKECHAHGMLMAVASAAVAKNVHFLVSALGLREYFREMLTGKRRVSQPKPNPEVYLKTAQKLRVKPEECVVFEDSFVGIEAAKRAGMKCVAIASTFPADDLRRETQADLIVPSFEGVSLPTLRHIFLTARAGRGFWPPRSDRSNGHLTTWHVHLWRCRFHGQDAHAARGVCPGLEFIHLFNTSRPFS